MIKSNMDGKLVYQDDGISWVFLVFMPWLSGDVDGGLLYYE